MKVLDQLETLKMFVDGRWVDSEGGETFEARSPATGELIAHLPKGTRADASRAIEAAHRARPAMAALGAFERGRLLHRGIPGKDGKDLKHDQFHGAMSFGRLPFV